MNARLKALVIMGLKTAGSFDGCLNYIEEDLTETEFDQLQKFFQWLTSKNLTIGYGNIDKRWAAWTKTQTPKYPIEDWRYEVANGDTKLGYKEWVQHQKESNKEES